MTEPGRFPWKPALCGSVLLLLALCTVSIRASVVTRGHELLRLEHRRAALLRRELDLKLDLQHIWHDLGREELAPPASGRSHS